MLSGHMSFHRNGDSWADAGLGARACSSFGTPGDDVGARGTERVVGLKVRYHILGRARNNNDGFE